MQNSDFVWTAEGCVPTSTVAPISDLELTAVGVEADWVGRMYPTSALHSFKTTVVGGTNASAIVQYEVLHARDFSCCGKKVGTSTNRVDSVIRAADYDRSEDEGRKRLLFLSTDIDGTVFRTRGY